MATYEFRNRGAAIKFMDRVKNFCNRTGTFDYAGCRRKLTTVYIDNVPEGILRKLEDRYLGSYKKLALE